MGKTKEIQVKEKHIWTFLIVLGIIILAIFLINRSGFNVNESNSYNSYKEENVVNTKKTESSTYCYNGECYTTYSEYENAKKVDEENKAYELADTKWQEYVSILNDDAQKTNDVVSQYCPSGIAYEQIPACVNNLQPRLEIYANHVVNAQNFLLQEGEVFSNKQTLLANLDDQVVYLRASANNLNQLVNEYNSWVQTQQNQQAISQAREQAIYDVLRILSGF